MKIVIAGSSGFIGSELIPYLYREGHEVIALTRKNKKSPYYWDPSTNVIDPAIFSDCDVVINLAGESIMGRWTKLKKAKMTYSRLHTTHFLVKTIFKLSTPPRLYIGASAIGYYGDRGIERLTEESSRGEGFLAKLCEKWEEIPQKLESIGVRVVMPRFGLVLGSSGGVLATIVPIFKMGFGGMLGDGSQIMSWIAIDDLLKGITHVMAKDTLRGSVNFTAPHPVTNRFFTRSLGKMLHRPTLFAVPKFCLALLLGKGTEMFLSSAAVFPEKLLQGGFDFKYPDLESALKKYLQVND